MHQKSDIRAPMPGLDRLVTAPAAFFEAARALPGHIRFLEDWEEVSLGEMAARVAGCMDLLTARGIRKGDHVAIFAENSVSWIAAALGIQACGAAFVSVHSGSSAAVAQHVISHSESKLLFASRLELARIGDPALEIPVVPIDEIPVSDPSRVVDRSCLDDRACLIYTSGTTANPKGVVLTHRNLATNGRDWVEANSHLLPECPREVLWLPFSHVFGWGAVCIGTIMGFTSCLSTARDVPQALVMHRPHVFMSVPIVLERLAAGASGKSQDLVKALGGEIRLVLSGGAALSPALKGRYRNAGIVLLEGYGLTETSPTLTLERPGIDRVDTVGLPYPSVEVRLEPDGEILAQGPSVFSGYWRDDEANQAAFSEDGWFRTGDLGEWTSEGYLRIVDRKKEILVLANGKKVAPQAVEARAAEEPWIARMVVFGNDRPALLALIDPDLEVISADLRRRVTRDALSDPDVRSEMAARIAALNARSSTFERIAGFAFAHRPLTVEDGDLTPSYKVRRQAVWKAFGPVLEAVR